MTWENEIALVTGASRGIGKSIALRLAQEGVLVVGTATSESGAESISQYLQNEAEKGFGLTLDVTSQDSIDKVFAAMQARCGMPSILVNNAGITRDTLLMRMESSDWDSIINTNLSSVYRVSKSCLRAMTKARKGRIISIASVVGVTGNPGQTNYAAAKAGLIGFSKSLAREIGSRNITVNVVAPGFIDTDMTQALAEKQKQALLGQIPLGRLGDTKEIASAVAFLASPEAAYITGETLHVNGGMFMS